MAVLRAHRFRQDKERPKGGEAWEDTGKVFTRENGSWLPPDEVSQEFRKISTAAGLPPINLRGLRHVAATLTHAGVRDLRTIKEVLRHSTTTLTSDTYTSLLPEIDRQVAEKAARLVPRAGRKAVGGTAGLTSGSRGAVRGRVLPLTKITDAKIMQVNQPMPADPHGGAGGTRTHDRRIMSPLL